MIGIRLAIRLGTRLARRRPWQTLAVCLAVALPVAVGTVAAAALATSQISPGEARTLAFGSADGRVSSSIPVDEVTAATEQLRQLLPAGSRLVADADLIKVPLSAPDGRRVEATGRALPLADPLVAGIYPIRAGRAAPGADTIVLSRALATRMGVTVGDTLTIGAHGDTTATVSGLAVDPIDTTRLFFTVPTTRDAALAGTIGSLRWYVGVPVGARVDTAALRTAGYTWIPRSDADRIAADATKPVQQPALLIGLGLLAETILLVSAVFAVVVRGQRRDIGLLATIGASARVRSWSFRVYALCVAAAGITAGVVAGEMLADRLVPVLQRRADADWGPFDPAAGTVALLAAVTVLATVTAVVVPTRRAVRQDVTVLLRDVEPLAPRSTRRVATVAGLLVTAAGICAVAAASSGSPLLAAPAFVCGIIGCSLAVIGVGSRLSRTAALAVPPALRSAIRTALAYPARTATTLMALAAVAAVASIAQTITASTVAKHIRGYTPTLPAATMLVTTPRELSTTEREAITGLEHPPAGYTTAITVVDGEQRLVSPLADLLGCLRQRDLLRNGLVDWDPCLRSSAATTPFPTVGIADADAAQHLTGAAWSDADRTAYHDGQKVAVVTTAGLAAEVTLVSRNRGPDGITLTELTHRPAITPPARDSEYSELPAVLVAPAAASGLHLIAAPGTQRYLIRPSRHTSTDAIRRQLPLDVQATAEITIDPGPPRAATAHRIARAITAATTATTAAIILAMLALWIGDLRREYAMLGALGATTRWRRTATATLGGLLAAASATIGTVWGVIAATCFLAGNDIPTVLPADLILALAAGVVIAAATSAALTPIRATAARRL